MKIQYTDHGGKFDDLNQGDLFRYANEFHLRTNLIVDKDLVEWNAVNLITGIYEFFSPETIITPCFDAEVITGL